jgi:hypothetical protein
MGLLELMEKYPVECKMIHRMGMTAQREKDKRAARKAIKSTMAKRSSPDDFCWQP